MWCWDQSYSALLQVATLRSRGRRYTAPRRTGACGHGEWGHVPRDVSKVSIASRVQRVHSVTCPKCPPLQVPGEVALAAALPQAALPGGRGPAAVLLQPRPRPGVPRPLPASSPHSCHSRHSWHEVREPRQGLLCLNVVITSVCLGILDIPMLLTSPNVTLTDTSSKSTSDRGGVGRCVVIHV